MNSKRIFLKTPTLNWSIPHYFPDSIGDSIHIWAINLSLEESNYQRLWEFLSDDEKARALQFKFRKDYCAFVAARGQMREILGGYAQSHPSSLEFSYHQYGKPILKQMSLSFNISHSKTLALCAVAENGLLGIDIEYIDKETRCMDLANRFFSQDESRALWEASEEERLYLFYKYWTRKEAFGKAISVGLRFPLDQLEVNVRKNEPARVLSGRAGADIYFCDLFPSDQYVASLAIDRSYTRFHGWQWSSKIAIF